MSVNGIELKRNDIVYIKSKLMFNHYGRINKVLGDDLFEVIVLGECDVYHIEDLVKTDYKGSFKSYHVRVYITKEKFESGKISHFSDNIRYLEGGKPCYRYRGKYYIYEVKQRFEHLPSLRKMKQKCSYWQNYIFVKNRFKHERKWTCNEIEYQREWDYEL